MKALIGTKLGMTTVIEADGHARPVTVIQAGPVTVTQIRTTEKDGYDAIQVGYGKDSKPSKPVAGHSKTLSITPKIVGEFTSETDVSIGDQFDVTIFATGDVVKVSGVSKGKGFAGTIKRHNFQRQRKTHGGKGNTRKPGSIGSMYPQKIFKGKRMAGRMGRERSTMRNLKIAFVDPKQNTLGVVGAVPGPRKSIVRVEGL